MTFSFVDCSYHVLDILEVLEVTRVAGEFTASESHWRKCEWVGHMTSPGLVIHPVLWTMLEPVIGSAEKSCRVKLRISDVILGVCYPMIE